MAKYGELPGDYALDALTKEADRRGKARGDPSYSYGKLMADTTEAERLEILAKYRKKFYRKHGGGPALGFDVSDLEAIEKIRKKQEKSEEV